MPIPVITQNPGIVWDYVGQFPWPRKEDILPLAFALPSGRYAQSVGMLVRENSYQIGYMLATNNSAAASFSCLTASGGQPYMQLQSAGVGRQVLGLDTFRAQINCGTGFTMAPGSSRSSISRVWWLKWLMQSPDAAPDLRCGIILQPANNSAFIRWPDDPVGINNSGGFGFNGDGAGQWQYVSYNRAGVALQREAIALPAHTLTEWNECELLIIADRPGITATLEIWFNGALIATRNWTGALLEPLTANEWYYSPTMGGGSTGAGGGIVNFSDIECRRGKFTRTGIEV